MKVEAEIIDVSVQEELDFSELGYHVAVVATVRWTGLLRHAGKGIVEKVQTAGKIPEEVWEAPESKAYLLKELMARTVSLIRDREQTLQKDNENYAKLQELHFQEQILKIQKERETQRELARIGAEVQRTFPPPDTYDSETGVGYSYRYGNGTAVSPQYASYDVGGTGTGTGSSGGIQLLVPTGRSPKSIR